MMTKNQIKKSIFSQFLIAIGIFVCSIPSYANVQGILTVNAGADVQVTLPNNSIGLSATATSSTGNILSYTWVKIAGPSTFVLANQFTPIPTLSGLVEGVYSLELTVTDDESNVVSDTINIVVSSRILIDFGNAQTSSPDANGNYWNNVTSGSNGVKITNALTAQNSLTSIGLQVVNRIDGTFNTGGPGVNSGNTVGVVNDYPNSATIDYAFAHPSTNTGRWRLTGLDTGTTYVVKFWGTRSGVPDPRIIEIKMEDETSYQSYDGANNSNYSNAAVFTFTGKNAMNFDIRVQAGSAFGYISLMDIQKVVNPTTPNLNPIAFAGSDIRLILPGNSLTLDGSSSNDPDGIIVSYTWRKLAGPQLLNIATPNSPSTVISNLFEGTYQFELKVVDNDGAEDLDTIKVQVGSRVLIDFGQNATTSPDPDFGNYWNLVTSGTNGVKLTNAITSTNISTNLGMEVVERIDGTFNLAGPGVNNDNISAGIVGDYPASATTDYAFAEPSTNTGRWKFTGLDNAKTYTFKFWGSRTAVQPRIIEIKSAEDSVWTSYDAANNTDFNRAAFFTMTGKDSAIFDIRVQSPSFFGYINVVDINYSTPCEETSSLTTVTSCDSYTWNGVTYTSSGLYSVLSINSQGCDSIANLDLTITQSNTSSEDISTCDGSYNWNGNTYTTSGNYFFLTTNAAGCDSTAILNLTILSPSSSTENVVACNSYTWNGTTYTTSGVYTFGTTNAAGCDSTATLNLSFVTPPVVNAGTDQQLVPGSSVTLSGSISGTYDNAFWTNASGIFTPDSTNLNASYTPSTNEVSAQLATLVLVAENACGSFSDTVLLLYTLPVRFTSISAKPTKQGNVIEWTTSSEFNNRGFDVQRSSNGIDFSSFSFIPSKATNGNSNTTLSYQTTDKTTSSNIVYYRLKQIDIDNKVQFSEVVKVIRQNENPLNIFTITPNPSKNNIKIGVSSVSNTRASMVITDASGKIMLKNNIQLMTGFQNIPVDITRYAVGSYFVHIQTANGQKSSAGFVKQ
jgi:hypothetical protein